MNIEIPSELEPVLTRANPEEEPAMGGPRPLWLTREEAEAVLEMCFGSAMHFGEHLEAGLFGKIGELVRSFGA